MYMFLIMLTILPVVVRIYQYKKNILKSPTPIYRSLSPKHETATTLRESVCVCVFVLKFRIGWHILEGRAARLDDTLQHQYVLVVLLQAQRVRLHVTQDPIEVLLVHAQQMAVVLLQHNGGRSARSSGLDLCVCVCVLGFSVSGVCY